jgi:hypothetical protein
MGATEVGFLVRCGLVFRSQSLFGVARLFNELGSSPVVTQVDSAGELTSEKRIGVSHGLGRSMMWRTGLDPGYWYFAVSHAILIMNLMLRVRTLSGVPHDITVWETHYGQRPNVGEVLLGPFGYLSYLILTKETRQRKGISNYWGVRAMPGINLGCEVNPRTMVYHHIITDGKTIFSSPNRIKPVPDVYPMRLQLESSPEDNKTCILLEENESSSAGRCKHIDTKFRFTVEVISDGVVNIRYTPSAYNYSDILTKPLPEDGIHLLTGTCNVHG